MSAMPPLATDMGLPALGHIAASLRTTPGLSALTISLFMAGFSATPLLYGPLSDRIGRKPVLIAGLGLFALASLLCAISTSITMLLVARLLEGAGAGAGITIALAIVRDLFSGSAARTRMSLVTMVLNIAPVIAPTLGAAILAFAGWRAIFASLAIIAALVVLASLLGYAESRQVQPGQAQASLLSGYPQLFRSRAAIGHILIFGCGFGCAFAYISGSSLVLIGLYRITPTAYGLLFACTALGIVAGAAMNGWLSARGTHHLPLLPISIACMIAVTLLLCVLALSGPVPLGLLMPLFILVTFCFGVLAPNASHGALEPIPAIAGVAGGVLASFQMICATVSSLLVSLLFAGFGLGAVTTVMLLFALTTGAALLILPHRRQAARSA